MTILLICLTLGTPSPPVQTAPFEFIEDLRFGGGFDDDRLIWGGSLTNITADGRGHIFIADTQSDRILEFDQDGTFIRQVAERGEGPGQFYGLKRFRILPEGGAIALEIRGGTTLRCHRFNRDYQFESVVHRSLIAENPVISPTGTRFAAFWVEPHPSQPLLIYRTGILDANLETLRIFTEASGPTHDRKRFGDANYWVSRIAENLTRMYQHMGVYGFDEAGFVYTASTGHYRIGKWSPDLKEELQVFKRDFKPILMKDGARLHQAMSLAEQIQSDPDLGSIVTQRVIEKALEKADLPAAKPPIFALLPFWQGHLMVVHDVDLETRTNLADVFSPKGRYLGQLHFPNHALVRLSLGFYLPGMTFQGQHAYTIETNDQGDLQAVRYRIIKKGDAQ